MEPRTEIDEALRAANEGGQDVGRERIDGEDMREAVLGGDAAWLLVSDGGVVNDCIAGAECIDLPGDAFRLRDAGEVADHDGFGTGNSGQGFVRALLVAGVQHGAVSLLDKKLRGHSAQAVRGAGDKYACHERFPTRSLLNHVARRCLTSGTVVNFSSLPTVRGQECPRHTLVQCHLGRVQVDDLPSCGGLVQDESSPVYESGAI